MASFEQSPATFPLTFYQGDDLLMTFQLKDANDAPISLSGATGAAKLRASQDVSANLLATFTVTVTDAPNGIFTVALATAVTTTLSGTGYWDLQLTIGGSIRTYLAGNVTINKQVTD